MPASGRRHPVEESLLRSEERFQMLVESVKDYAIFMLDAQGRIVSWNAGAQRIKGYAAEEIIGQHFSRFYPPEDIAARKPQKELEVAAREGRIEDEGWRLRKDGSRFWANVVISAIRDREGKLMGFSKVTRDLTESKRTQDKLNALLADLQRSNKDLEQFASFASHDLQEPLRKISIFAEFLRTRYEGKLGADADDFLRDILSAAQRMRRLISELLSYSRLSRAQRLVEPVRLKAALDQALDALELRVQESGARIEVLDLPMVKANAEDMERLFENLVGNALKFHKTGAPRISVFAQRTGLEWKIGVRDNGIGIDPKYAQTIFEPFRRLHAKGEYDGSGIGLAICRRIVELHHGRIWVESKPGEGSTFYFSLPVAS